jgi:dTDP-glucose 4,6-dehydratase
VRVLVTGGAGFIGGNLVRHLVARGTEKVVCLDALTYAGNLASLSDVQDASCFRFVHGDIRDDALLDRVFEEEQVDAVMHLAAESHVDRSILDSAPVVLTNVVGTVRLLEAARRHWKLKGRAGRFLHVSTDEVFGSLGEQGKFSETTPYAPNSPYSASKAASDHFVRAYHHTHGMDVVTTNCSNNYGPWQFPEKLIPLMILKARDGEPLPVYGDGRNVRDWLHVQDHVEALVAALERGRAGEVYCIGGDSERENIAIVHQICDAVDEELGVGAAGPRRRLLTFVKDRPGHDRRYAIDASKAVRELGWRPRIALEQGLRETVRWYLGNKAWLDACLDGSYREYYERNYRDKM